MRTLGLLALGETPRDDVTPTLTAILGPEVRIIQAGVLDGLSPPLVDALRAREGESPLETRLRSGHAIGLSKSALLPRLAAVAAMLARDCDAVLLLCSGEFPALAASCPTLIQPIHILRGVVSAVAKHRLLGVVGPAPDLPDAPAQWAPYAPRVICAAASPYEPVDVAIAAARDLAGRGAELLLLDDMGFGERHRELVRSATSLPVLCATTLAARALRELV
ncbi:MAG: AroM family protein [Gemmatimonadaceae bacterium]